MRKDLPSKSKIEIRLTAEEKQKIKDCAAEKNMTLSEFVRYACETIFSKESNT